MLVTFAPVFAKEWRFVRLELRNRRMVPFMSVKPPKAEVAIHEADVRYVPIPEVEHFVICMELQFSFR